ncbi:putative manganese transporter [Dielma fastidiosa]|uniref:Arsenic efflux protein n=1 Tax=Dielma fastidiosa TaxID=1034346 RepID=A0AB35UUX7_9FIRM|nr:putative manganese transporter [Dielma fastidiosa]MDY5169256.1 arsenic efflux protein [Dielma fastidiosa]
MIDVIIDALVDTVKLLPLLYLSYLLIDFIDKRSSAYRLNYLFIKNLGPLFGALLGLVPQCGFSVIAASLFAQQGISAGTLVACFMATSDEALPMLLAYPSEYKSLGLLLILKLVIAILSGYLLDFVLYKKTLNEEDDFEIELSDPGCSCGSNSFMNALNRTLKTTMFILGINLVIGFVLFGIGEDALSSLLNVHPMLQPFAAALIGFIPNCAASILLVQLYVLGGLSFGSMVAGLCTGAGIGMAVLWKQNKNKRENSLLLLYMFLFSSAAGLLLQLML